MNLIYTSVGYNIKWLEIVVLLLNSIEKYTIIKDFDFLIICDDNMFNYISDFIKYDTNYSFNIKIHNVKKNSSQPCYAAINKLNIYDFDEVDNYEKILFIDGDILSLMNLNEIFEVDIKDNILYVYKEDDDIMNHNCLYWGLSNYTDEELLLFHENSIYPFNTGIFLFKNTNEMKMDFEYMVEFMSTYDKPFFYEQSIMNYHFNRKMNVNYKLFTTDNYIMFLIPDYSKQHHNNLIHFCAMIHSGETKYGTITHYIKNHSL